MKGPLVSILIPNYNYASTLKTCLESVLVQTYTNIEVIISDNRSSDDSYDIIQSYRKKFLEQGIWCTVMQNKRNIGSNGNASKCFENGEGLYHMWLSSDDYLEPDAIEKMVTALAEHPEAGCVMAHRNEIDEKGNINKTAPFYNQSCLIHGEDQATVYMMAGIAVSSQILWNRSIYCQALRYKHLRFQVAGDWYDNFLVACVSDVIYIKKPLINYRVRVRSETGISEKNLVGVLEHYMLINAFCDIADSFGLTKPQKRKEEAIRKLGFMCLRYARKMIRNGEISVSGKYLQLASVFCEGIEGEEQYKNLSQCLQSDNPTQYLLEHDDPNNGVYVRTVSYDPPENSIRLPELE